MPESLSHSTCQWKLFQNENARDRAVSGVSFLKMRSSSGYRLPAPPSDSASGLRLPLCLPTPLRPQPSISHRRPRPPDLPPVQPPACASCCPSGSAFQSTSNFCLPLGPPAVLSIKFQLASVLSRQRCQRLQPPTSVGYCISGFCLPANPRFASAINSPALPAINFRISSAANS